MNEPSEKLIWWRSESDVANATIIGQYNASDLNRVESWIKYIAQELTTAGYDFSNLQIKTNWTKADMRDQWNMERIRKNILKLMDFTYNTKIKTSSNTINYSRANNYEKILFEIYNFMNGTQNWYVYCGVANMGQNRLWQHRYREFYPLLQFNITWNYVNDYMKQRWNEFDSSFTWELFV